MEAKTIEKVREDKTLMELCIEALNTMPVHFENGEIIFAVNGITPGKEIEFSGDVGDAARRKYEKECAEHNLIPYSTVPLEYDVKLNGFRPSTENQNCFGDGYIKWSAQNNALIGMLFAGRFNQIAFNAKDWQHIQGTVLDTLIKNKYRITGGYLNIATNKITEPDWDEDDMYRTKEKVNIDTSLIINKDGLELNLGTRMNPCDKDDLIDWYNCLKEKYETKT